MVGLILITKRMIQQWHHIEKSGGRVDVIYEMFNGTAKIVVNSALLSEKKVFNGIYSKCGGLVSEGSPGK